MTEEDTFKRLKRPTFVEFREIVLTHWNQFKIDYPRFDRTGQYKIWLKMREVLAVEYDWTWTEYHTEVKRRKANATV